MLFPIFQMVCRYGGKAERESKPSKMRSKILISSTSSILEVKIRKNNGFWGALWGAPFSFLINKNKKIFGSFELFD